MLGPQTNEFHFNLFDFPFNEAQLQHLHQSCKSALAITRQTTTIGPLSAGAPALLYREMAQHGCSSENL